MAERNVQIMNRNGLHARTAAADSAKNASACSTLSLTGTFGKSAPGNRHTSTTPRIPPSHRPSQKSATGRLPIVISLSQCAPAVSLPNANSTSRASVASA